MNLFGRLWYALRHMPMSYCDPDWWELRRQTTMLLRQYSLVIAQEVPNPYLMFFRDLNAKVTVDIKAVPPESVKSESKETLPNIGMIHVFSNNREIAYGVAYTLRNHLRPKKSIWRVYVEGMQL